MTLTKCQKCDEPATAEWECGCLHSDRRPRCNRHSLDGYECLNGDGFYKVILTNEAL